MKAIKYFYLLSGVALLAVAVFLGSRETLETLEAGSALYIVLVYVVLALFTFPTGIIGILVVGVLAYMGIATVAEALFVSILISFFVAYWQWFVLFPKIFKGKPTVLETTR